MGDEEGKIIFNKEMVEKLHNIDLMVARLIYNEIEKLDLDGREKVMAHYYVAKYYYDGVLHTMKDIGIDDIIVNIKKDNKNELESESWIYQFNHICKIKIIMRDSTEKKRRNMIW